MSTPPFVDPLPAVQAALDAWARFAQTSPRDPELKERSAEAMRLHEAARAAIDRAVEAGPRP